MLVGCFARDSSIQQQKNAVGHCETGKGFALAATPAGRRHRRQWQWRFARILWVMEIILEIGREKNCCRIDWVQFKNNNVGDQFFKTIKGTQSVDYIDYKRIAI